MGGGLRAALGRRHRAASRRRNYCRLGLNSAALLVGSSGILWAPGHIHDGALLAPIRLRPLRPGGSIKGVWASVLNAASCRRQVEAKALPFGRLIRARATATLAFVD